LFVVSVPIRKKQIAGIYTACFNKYNFLLS
jgi:hypothetical protein